MVHFVSGVTQGGRRRRRRGGGTELQFPTEETQSAISRKLGDDDAIQFASRIKAEFGLGTSAAAAQAHVQGFNF